MITRNEKRILSKTIKEVRTYNIHAWWQLKREIFDFGYQSYYPSQSFFENPAKVALNRLSKEDKNELLREWNSAVPAREKLNDQDLIAGYVLLVIEEIVRRAELAAYRTENW